MYWEEKLNQNTQEYIFGRSDHLSYHRGKVKLQRKLERDVSI